MTVSSFQGRKSSKSVLAMQYREISRRQGKYGDIVERNSSQIASLLRSTLREATIPDGSKEGSHVLLACIQGRKIVMQLGDWLVVEDDQFKVYTPADFHAEFAEALL